VDVGEIIGIAVGIVGAAPVVVVTVSWARRRRGARRVLKMSERGQLDVVVTTSQVAISPRGPRVSRPVTGIGQLEGAMICARSVGRFYRKKRLVAHMSVNPRNVLDNDVLLLGGLSGNAEAHRLYDALRDEFGADALYYNDDGTNDLSLAGWHCKDYDLGLRSDHSVERDIGLVVLWASPESPQDARRRAILCLGFSSYGTEAAASFAFAGLLPTSARTLIWDRGPFREVRRECRTIENCVICVVSASFSAQGVRMGAPQLMAWASYGPLPKKTDKGRRAFQSLHSPPAPRMSTGAREGSALAAAAAAAGPGSHNRGSSVREGSRTPPTQSTER
jgi:hypothetical protein